MSPSIILYFKCFFLVNCGSIALTLLPHYFHPLQIVQQWKLLVLIVVSKLVRRASVSGHDRKTCSSDCRTGPHWHWCSFLGTQAHLSVSTQSLWELSRRRVNNTLALSWKLGFLYTACLLTEWLILYRVAVAFFTVTDVDKLSRKAEE